MLDRFERFLLSVSDISRCWHKLSADEAADYGLKGPHVVYLTVMYRYEDGVTASELGEICHKDKADVSRMLAIMEQKGLAKKYGVNESMYRGVWKLTDEGRAAAEYIRQRASLAVKLAGEGLSDASRTSFYESLERIAANLCDLCETGIPEE